MKRRSQLAAVAVTVALAAVVISGVYAIGPLGARSPQTPTGTSMNDTQQAVTNPPTQSSTNQTATGPALRLPLGWDGFDEMVVTAQQYTTQYTDGAYSTSGWVLLTIDAESCCLPATMAENVTGAQVVTGSWQTGYNVSYTGLKTLVLEFIPADFSVMNIMANPLPDVHQSLSFSTGEKNAISFVLSNKTVQGMADLSRYYVSRVTFFPADSANQTYAGDFLVYLNEVNGKGSLMVLANPTLTQVLGIWP